MKLIANLSIVKTLRAKGNTTLAYQMLRKQYEENVWGDGPPDQQIEALIQLAELSLEVGNEVKCSRPYIDEACILMEELEEAFQSQYTQRIKKLNL